MTEWDAGGYYAALGRAAGFEIERIFVFYQMEAELRRPAASA